MKKEIIIKDLMLQSNEELPVLKRSPAFFKDKSHFCALTFLQSIEGRLSNTEMGLS